MTRVCIPIEFKKQGGGYYFLQALESFLTAQGWEVIKDITSSYEILFTNHWLLNRGHILKAIRYNPAVRIVQRIDGAAQDYGRPWDADRRQHMVSRLADLTVFQSNYCRYSTREKFPVIAHDGPVIYNPVNSDFFCPEGPRITFPEKILVACLTWSINKLKGAESVYAAARENPDVGFVLCGRYEDAPALPNIHLQGVLDREALAVVLRSCHVLLTFSQNEACPNHVLEALASGLPVLYHDSGAMAEVIGDCGLPVTVSGFRGQLEKIMTRHHVLSDGARRRALSDFHPRVIFPRYMKVMQDVLNPSLSVPCIVRLGLAYTEPLYSRFSSFVSGLKKRSRQAAIKKVQII